MEIKQFRPLWLHNSWHWVVWTQGSVMGYLCITSSEIDVKVEPSTGSLLQWARCLAVGNWEDPFALDFLVSEGKSLPRDWDDHWRFPHPVIPNLDHLGSIARQHRSYHDQEVPGRKVPSTSEVSDPVDMDGKTRHQPNKDYNRKKDVSLARRPPRFWI
ncbi:hypothetical protein N7455_005458 [Penicillium solitum]|uniref:uncharacterized protein n=1 Tax=Penicillium solitum TaxID=60172 RepID=UPI0032C4723B|nr:hypothetical protein N7455_005458 [Penicillium solitum]